MLRNELYVQAADVYLLIPPNSRSYCQLELGEFLSVKQTFGVGSTLTEQGHRFTSIGAKIQQDNHLTQKGMLV